MKGNNLFEWKLYENCYNYNDLLLMIQKKNYEKFLKYEIPLWFESVVILIFICTYIFLKMGVGKGEEVSGLWSWRGRCVMCGEVVKAPQDIFWTIIFISDLMRRFAQVSSAPLDKDLFLIIYLMRISRWMRQDFNGHRKIIKTSYSRKHL